MLLRAIAGCLLAFSGCLFSTFATAADKPIMLDARLSQHDEGGRKAAQLLTHRAQWL